MSAPALTPARFAAPLPAVDELHDTGQAVIAVKRIVATDPYLAGHYPHFTIYPGVFSIETVYQATRTALEHRGGPGTRVELAAIASVRFSAPLLPGDTLTATCELTPVEDGLAAVKAKCRRADGQTSAQIRLTLRVHDA